MKEMQTRLSALILPVAMVITLALLLTWMITGRDQSASNNEQQGVLKNSIGLEMVLIPGGRYTMGSAEDAAVPSQELPAHTVTVAPFYLSRFEVTQAQWQAVMGFNPSAYRSPRRPVERVSWAEVQEFIRRLNQREQTVLYRLPSEAEWEYAARAGSSDRWFSGNGAERLSEYAWYGQARDLGTRVVGQLAPNPWGLYDVYGNVWEWVQDCWHDHYQGAPADGRGWISGDCAHRVLRGGGWNSTADYARSAVRGSFAANLDDSASGFRLARSR